MKKNTEKTTHLKFFGIPKLIPFLKPYRVPMLFMILLALGGSAVEIIFPKYQEYAINNYIADNHLDGIWVFGGTYLLLLIVKIIMDVFSTYLGTKMEMKIGRDLKQKSFNHLQTLSFSYFNRNSVGYIHSRVSSDTNRIGSLVSWYLLDCIWNGTYLIGALFVMFRTNVKLSLIVLAVIPVVSVIVAFMQKKLIATNRKIREMNSQITGNFNEGITGAKTIKTLVAEDKMYDEFKTKTGEMKRHSVMESRYRGLLWTTLNVAS
ncbi:MAG: ABC transporter ATP-binding protein, partial [Clostridia bacterium]|nr:ABC transporter ATP-binding protein [Clostridia bacterium]